MFRVESVSSGEREVTFEPKLFWAVSRTDESPPDFSLKIITFISSRK